MEPYRPTVTASAAYAVLLMLIGRESIEQDASEALGSEGPAL